jgi:hypothetical protein
MEPGHPPLVLILEVAVGTEADDDDRDLVGAVDQVRGDVVLARQTAVGAVAAERTIDVDGVHTLRTVDPHHDAPAPPERRHLERPTVDAGRVACGESRWRPGEGHLDVRVVREVVDRVVQRPVGRHVDIDSAAALARDRGRRHLVGSAEQLERPSAVERSA